VSCKLITATKHLSLCKIFFL